jgi:hypothetical protein
MDEARDGSGAIDDPGGRRYDEPTLKRRRAVQHMVRRLLDSLAPERPPGRSGQPEPEIRLLRSPHGCILQAAARAVSVSWFPPPDHGAALGELQVIVWRGVVTRPGSANHATSQAVLLREAVLQPEAVDGEAWVWRTADGAVWDTGALAARCHALAADAAAVDPAAPTHAL